MTKKILVVLFIVFIGLIILFIILFNSHKTITQNTSTLRKESVTIVPKKSGNMKITSSAFENNGTIPSQYTCDGEGINPPLAFEDVPSNAKSLVMLMDDPDVPKNLLPAGVFDHWVIYNIPPTTHEIAESSVPAGVSQGLNGAGQEKYTPPCPPDREHRYFFKLFALDSTLEFQDPSKVTKQMVIDKMQGHIIEEAQLIGLYNRPQNK
jgi:Raf kinase inhibitor-like YbhB/YbcL family protein